MRVVEGIFSIFPSAIVGVIAIASSREVVLVVANALMLLLPSSNVAVHKAKLVPPAA